MAIYHCSVKIIGRNEGRSSVSAAAYRAGECIVNEYDGIEHDFTKKNWVQYKKIIVPDHVPKEYIDRKILWNEVEKIEKSNDAQLAREFELALPIELTREQQIELVEDFAQQYLVSQGMIVDIAIHNPPRTNDRHQPIGPDGKVTKNVNEMQFINPHAHILCTMRPIDKQGKWEKKSEVEYICKNGDEEKAFTASEFKAVKHLGWEKQYRYYEDEKKVYYVPSEAEKKELKRVGRTPKTTPYGRKNETVERWNQKEQIYEWRKQWETVVNNKFEQIKLDTRIDSRSFKNQGRYDEIPPVHMGVSSVNIEKRAERKLLEGEKNIVRSDIGHINRQIKEYNQFVRAIKKKIDELTKKAKGFIEETAKKLEGLRAKLIGNNYKEQVFMKKSKEIELNLKMEKDRLEKYKNENDMIEKANLVSSDKIKLLVEELKSSNPLQMKKKSNLQKQIKEEQIKIENRLEYKQSLETMCNYFATEDYQNASKQYIKNQSSYEKVKYVIADIKENSKKLIKEYNAVKQTLSSEVNEEVEVNRELYRTSMEKIVEDDIRNSDCEIWDESVYEEAKRKTEIQLNDIDYGDCNNYFKGIDKEKIIVHMR